MLYIIWSLGLGGAERVVVNLAKGLDRTRFNPLVCCLNWPGVYADELEDEGIEVIALHKKRGIDISIVRKIIAIIRHNRIDIVHTHLWTANFWGRIAAVCAAVPVVIASEHGISQKRGALRFFADRVLSLFSDRITLVSENVRKSFARRITYNQKKLKVIHNGVDVDKFGGNKMRKSPLQREFGIKRGELVFSCIGRLSEEKGHKYLFKALSFLNGRYKMKLLVVGDGRLFKNFKLRVKNYRLEDRVVFTGLRKDVADILAITDVLVIPSLREAHSVVALEAMACGVPVVTTDVGGMNEIVVDNQTGVLVPARNIEYLAVAIERLMENKYLRLRMGEVARRRVEELFSVGKMVADTQTLYEQLFIVVEVKTNV